MKVSSNVLKALVLSMIVGGLMWVPLYAQDEATENKSKKEEKQSKRRKSFKIAAGITGSTIAFSESRFESAIAAGYDLGVSYRKGRFTSWEIGLRFLGSGVVLDETDNASPVTEQTLNIHQLELPVTFGINLLAPVQRLIGVRLFGGLSPGVILNIGDNPLGLTDDDINTFQLAGHLGAGVDVAFLFLETGYNRGFINLFDEGQSKLSQLYLNIGFRF